MKPKSFNRDMKRELAGTLAAHGVAAVIACAAAAGAWDYARWWTLSLISGLSALLRLPTADPGPEPTHVFRGPLEAAADAAASGEAGELLRGQQHEDGRWYQGFRLPGERWFEIDVPVGEPSPWLTFFALRVLRWWDEG